MKVVALLFLLLTQFAWAKSAEVVLCGKTLKVEIADTEETRSKGLMFRKSLDKNAGMLFVYHKEEFLSFWMKNTYIPLSIAFFDKNKKLVSIHDMEPLDSSRTYTSKGPAMYAIEVNKGWFVNNKIGKDCTFEYK